MAWWQRQHGETTRGRVVAILRRGQQTVEQLAATLGLTDNAVRAQLASLERDGVVRVAGTRREGSVGKPATLYGVSAESSSLFSSAYAPLLTALLAEIAERLSTPQLDTLLRGAGRRLAASLPEHSSFEQRVAASAGFLTGLGADADLVKTHDGYEIRGHGCVLAEAVAACPSACGAVEELLTEVIGVPVKEGCDRTGQPSCRFLIPAP